jgi:hypothetical protein
MTDDSNEYPRFSGFSRTRTIPEYLDAIKQLGCASPAVSAALVDILTEERAKQPPLSGADEPTSLALSPAGAAAPACGEAKRASTSERIHGSSADDVGPSVAATASIEIEVHSEAAAPPGNSRRLRSANSRARKKSRWHSKSARTAATRRQPLSTRGKKRRAAEPAVPAQKRGRLSRLELHQSHCGICGDDLQEEIDERFINWEFVDQIADDYSVTRSALYRHAHATGLFLKRDRNVRHALDRIIHRLDRVKVNADSVIRAVKMLTHINAGGEWVNPPTQVVFSTAAPRSTITRVPEKAELGGTQSHLIKRLKP